MESRTERRNDALDAGGDDEHGVVDVIEVSDASDVGGELHRLVASVVDAIDGATGATVSLLVGDEGDQRYAVIDSADLVAPVREADLLDAHGPGATCRESGEVVRISSTADDGAWETFREASQAIGIMSTASFPISVAGVHSGALTVLSPDYHAFDVMAIRSGRQIAAELGQLVESADGAWYEAAVDR